MPAKAAKTVRVTETVRSVVRPSRGRKSQAKPEALGRGSTHTRINAFVSSLGRQNQAKRDAR